MANFRDLRTLLAQVANRLYDNPYVFTNKESDFNCSPVNVGYYALGMYVVGLFKWLNDSLKRNPVNKIHFVARDGYLLKEVYDEFRKLNPTLPESNYLYVSRVTTILLDMNKPEDLYSLRYKVNAWHATPRSILNLVKEVLSVSETEVWQELGEDSADAKFNSREGLDKFITKLINSFSEEMDFNGFKQKYKKYFGSIIKENEAIWDIGYNGRVEMALTRLLGYPVNSYYIHKNSGDVYEKMKRTGFVCDAFYSYKPGITGVLREHMMMKLAGSTIGYDFSKEVAEPILDNWECSYPEKYVTTLVQKSALSFVKDIIEQFGLKVMEMNFEYEDATAVLEYYLHDSKRMDRRMFSCLMFEDVLGEGKQLRALDFWNSDLNRLHNESHYLGVDYNKKEDYTRIEAEDQRPNIALPKNKKEQSRHVSRKVGMFLDIIENPEKENKKENLSKCADNTSNLVFWDAIIDKVSPNLIPNWYMTRKGGFDETEYDVFLTTNLVWLQEGENISYMNKVLDRIGDRVLLPIGIGLSSDTEKPDFKLSTDCISTLKRIAERCKSIGVRGEYTAEILSKYGIKNSRIIGCPSLYRNVSGMKKLANDSKKIETVVASFKPFYGKLSKQEVSLLSWYKKNNCKLIETTSLDLDKLNIENEAIYNELKIYEENKTIYFDVNAWRQEIKKTDFSLGLNFHNNVLAMQAGVPALFITSDTSVKELCRFFKLPNLHISEFDGEKNLLSYYLQADYSEFISNIDHCYAEYVAFLNENGVPVDESKFKVIEK